MAEGWQGRTERELDTQRSEYNSKCRLSQGSSFMMNKSYKARYNPSSLNGSIIQRRARIEMESNSDTNANSYAL